MHLIKLKQVKWCCNWFHRTRYVTGPHIFNKIRVLLYMLQRNKMLQNEEKFLSKYMIEEYKKGWMDELLIKWIQQKCQSSLLSLSSQGPSIVSTKGEKKKKRQSKQQWKCNGLFAVCVETWELELHLVISKLKVADKNNNLKELHDLFPVCEKTLLCLASTLFQSEQISRCLKRGGNLYRCGVISVLLSCGSFLDNTQVVTVEDDHKQVSFRRVIREFPYLLDLSHNHSLTIVLVIFCLIKLNRLFEAFLLLQTCEYKGRVQDALGVLSNKEFELPSYLDIVATIPWFYEPVLLCALQHKFRENEIVSEELTNYLESCQMGRSWNSKKRQYLIATFYTLPHFFYIKDKRQYNLFISVTNSLKYVVIFRFFKKQRI
ncbi:hypothetical protein RFI_12353 [Reticulomyxa filosa]|uniref:Uncharacterized protein n=1 Tax=Reticulomyxa filosa TaxID=46433 RepID=X6NHH4_RETFI|nr:hypothetical protein RFI_12353 [Reticulomyxa filosa]|eukprot:ETO24802.1 hypothetical protein RFI_12353 [Reticulomyxa filosa]